jgi:hypothetical protein
MTRHEEFLTEDFLLYAAECKRMAALAGPPKANRPARAAALPRLADWISPIVARRRQPQQDYAGWGQPAYS